MALFLIILDNKLKYRQALDMLLYIISCPCLLDDRLNDLSDFAVSHSQYDGGEGDKATVGKTCDNQQVWTWGPTVVVKVVDWDDTGTPGNDEQND